MEDIIATFTHQVQETYDDLIFSTVTEFLGEQNEFKQCEISKEELIRAVNLYYQKGMTGNEYQTNAMKTNDGHASDRLASAMNSNLFIDLGELFDACLGLSGEVGELNDIVKKWVFHESELDEVHLKKELGDVMWYVAMCCHAMKWNLDEVLQMNVDKLKARYPDGFDVFRANHKDAGDV